ncbi:type II toxin-antitoxin system RelE/ParE family toxin [Paraglaciecola arctica]|uniref:Toxin n=1 Tax=Paraglaciecola arctica BSs20135 TaxID=493475 RepID=K6Z3Y6_9ALTE|nr:type II toxin-antitoxin system RelE/ParE family toxin [Paraglaciecola arctica]GAC18145.1 plasmid stabilization system [Paraglaciecola arctica BSs20135]|tara:strand:+ start:537 stop:833 length:297 start_codon:yes stop_codon:yes gene_type:complete
MKTYQLVISPIARNDLADISKYTTQNWRAKQTKGYLLSLKEDIWSLLQLPLKGVARPELIADLKSFPTSNHVIFYRITQSKVEIVRVLHKRQDPQLHF